MIRKLTPMTGLIVAGLIGEASASCWWHVTKTCVPANTYVGTMIDSSGNTDNAYADGNWSSPSSLLNKGHF